MTDRDFLKEIGRRLQATRILAGAKQSEAALQAGISVNFLSQVENGRLPCSLLTLKRLAEVYGKNVVLTLTSTGEPHA